MFITLLTDFGTADYFVGALKGAILSVNEDARIFDLTHDIAPHDIKAAAFTLLAAYKTFPARTIHLAVVDPGVGSARLPVLVCAGDYFFIGPDSGLFSFVIERESPVRVFHLTRGEFFRQPVSATFHGRDLFAPVAGALSKGVRPEELGAEIADAVRLAPLAPKPLSDGTIEAAIIHIDRFGNCITNLTRSELTDEMIARQARLWINGTEVKSFRRFFNQSDAQAGELFALWGSAGFLEICLNRASAAQLLQARVGQPVMLEERKEKR